MNKSTDIAKLNRLSLQQSQRIALSLATSRSDDGSGTLGQQWERFMYVAKSVKLPHRDWLSAGTDKAGPKRAGGGGGVV